MKNKNGFTLIEMLFVFLIISLLTLIVMPSLFSVLKKQETKEFISVLDADMLFIQNQAFGTRENVRIIFARNYYTVKNVHTKEEFIRHYPNHLTYDLQLNNRISFNNSGTIVNPTTFIFNDRNVTFHIVFPLGKGRHYVEKQ